MRLITIAQVHANNTLNCLHGTGYDRETPNMQHNSMAKEWIREAEYRKGLTCTELNVRMRVCERDRDKDTCSSHMRNEKAKRCDARNAREV